jgi:pyruvate dehydrogenase E2 component (dihydrolipoamide acetyltransferase)
MATEVILPKVDMDMATGRISRWFVADGAAVKQGDVLFEIETDKAAMEIEAPVSGLLRNPTAEGSEVPIGSVVGWIYGEGEAVASAPATKAAEPVVESKRPTASAVPPVAVQDKSKGTRVTPLARRIALEAGIVLSALVGTGAHGCITRSDVEDAIKTKAAPAALKAKAEAKQATSDEGVRGLFTDGKFREIPHDKMRLTIARRLVESKSTVPHFYVSADCRLDALLKLRAEINASAPTLDGKPAYKVSINDMVIKAWALALNAVPMANVTWTEDSMLCHEQVDIGVAVSVDGGLITPIIRRAESKRLSDISNEMKDLAIRAKSRKLKNDEYNGGTTAISNLGMFGVKTFNAIINPPHATILAVGAGEERGVCEKGAFVPATLMSVTLSVDHRAVDGALGAEALQAFRGLIEKPMAMLV